MTIREDLQQSPAFVLDQNLFYHKNLKRDLEFEKSYVALRQKENRLYSNDVVQNLPDVAEDDPLKKEWQVRKKSLQKLLKYLGSIDSKKTILEIGCGNGWLSHHLATIPGADILAIDINEKELLQGASLFKAHKNLTFAYADILQTAFISKFDYIILASSIQYFPDVNLLIQELLGLLSAAGEIHIIDSPIYTQRELKSAQIRTSNYFINFNVTASFYFHHSWQSFKVLRYEILYNPKSWMNKISSWIVKNDSPFPWIRIRK